MDLHHQPLNGYEFVGMTQLEMCFSVLVNLDLKYYKMNTLAKTRKKNVMDMDLDMLAYCVQCVHFEHFAKADVNDLDI